MLFGRSSRESSGRASSAGSYNFTEDMRRVLAQARSEAVGLRHEYVGTEHILLALVHMPDHPGAKVLARLRVHIPGIREAVERTVKPGTARVAHNDSLPYTSRAKKTLELAMTAARDLRHDYVGTEHLLLGVLHEEKGIGAQVLRSFGVTVERVLATMHDAPPAFTIHIDDKADTSIYEQIIARVQEGIATGALEPGERLPTVRRLADDLDIAPGTVARAYAELERLGLVITEGARGTRVAPRVPSAKAEEKRTETLAGLMRPIVVAGFHLGATADELRTALESAMQDIFRKSGEA